MKKKVVNQSLTRVSYVKQNFFHWKNAISGECVMVPASLENCLSSILTYIAQDKQINQRSNIAIRPGTYMIVHMKGDTEPGNYPTDSNFGERHCHVCDDVMNCQYPCTSCDKDVCYQCRTND